MREAVWKQHVGPKKKKEFSSFLMILLKLGEMRMSVVSYFTQKTSRKNTLTRSNVDSTCPLEVSVVSR